MENSEPNLEVDVFHDALDTPHQNSLTNRQKANQYHGFARYTDEYNKPPPVLAARAQSMNGASQAALAALQMHSKPNSPQMASAPRQTSRSNSLSNYGRSNSMRTYSYTPKASYHTGPTLPQPRSNSLRTSSLRSPLQRPHSFAAGRNSYVEEEPEDDDAESIVITTKTTKVVDSMGRTKSITTETIKTLPDGSNIIETTTKNISRPSSRSNSLRNNSITHTGNGNYNLGKIEEDLQDFDYNYLDHENIHQPPRLNHDNHEVSPRTQSYIQEQRNALAPAFKSPQKPDERAASITSTQSPKRLKSILKNSTGHNFQNSPQQDGASDDISVENTSYKASSFSPNKPHTVVHDLPQQASVTSGGTSIKFRETVETISYPAESHNLVELSHEDLRKKEQEKQKNVDLYAQAMKVAMEKVYGRSSEDNTNYHTPPQSPVIDNVAPLPKDDVTALAEKKLKKDHKRDKVESSGVTKNYVYENHHRDFSVRSMRGGPVAEEGHVSTRKERAKEERRLAKEEEKRNAELLKTAEKERKKEEKLAKKKQKKLFFSFGKRKNSVGDELMNSSRLADATVDLSATGFQSDPPADLTHQQELQYANPAESPIQNPGGSSAQVRAPVQAPTGDDQVKQSQTSHPQFSEPEVGNSAAIQPTVVQPKVVQPEVVQPEVAQPEVTQPQGTNFPTSQPDGIPDRAVHLDLNSDQESTNPDDTAEFVDVPEFADEAEEKAKVDVIPDKRQEVRSVSPMPEVLHAPGTPQVIDEIIQGDGLIPPRADLQAYSSNISHEPVFEGKLPTLVAGADNNPEVLTDSYTNGDLVDHQDLSENATSPQVVEKPSKTDATGPKEFVNDDLKVDALGIATTNKQDIPELERPLVKDKKDELKPQSLDIQPQFSEAPELAHDEVPQTYNYGVTADSAVSGESEQTLQSVTEAPVVKKELVQEPNLNVPVASAISPEKSQMPDASVESAGPAKTSQVTSQSPGYTQSPATNSITQPTLPSPALSEAPESKTNVEPVAVNPRTHSADERNFEHKQQGKSPSKKHRFRKIIDKYFINNYNR